MITDTWLGEYKAKPVGPNRSFTPRAGAAAVRSTYTADVPARLESPDTRTFARDDAPHVRASRAAFSTPSRAFLRATCLSSPNPHPSSPEKSPSLPHASAPCTQLPRRALRPTPARNLCTGSVARERTLQTHIAPSPPYAQPNRQTSTRHTGT